ncbi:MAG: hypothetical protein DMD61_06550 [Gemmatimonadetes bacterium]|nr:MAG: hypothetical protein DMD61_06550 [Gemmatimonadota bacterium]
MRQRFLVDRIGVRQAAPHGDEPLYRRGDPNNASATIIGTYAYVNPVIAVLLGWLILREPVTARTFLAMALIIGAVVWIQFSHRIKRSVGRAEGRNEGTVTAGRDSSTAGQGATT